MLWQHRRWVIQKLISDQGDPSNLFIYEKDHESRRLYGRIYKRVYHEMSALDHPLELEFLVIFQAGELHPKNYYAWAYARWLIDSYGYQSRKSDLRWLIDTVYQVCKSHVSDISAWSFLQRVLEDSNDQEAIGIYTQLCYELAELCPQHEAMWTFLRWGFSFSKVPGDSWDQELRQRANIWHLRVAELRVGAVPSRGNQQKINDS